MRKMKKIGYKKLDNNKESGITLIILVITVIIMSILTGVTIYLGTTSVKDISEQQDLSVVNMIQEIVIAQYTKTQYLSQTGWKLSEHSTQPPSYYGECILTPSRYIQLPSDDSSMFPSKAKYIADLSVSTTTYDDCYYRLDENVLKNLGITDSTDGNEDVHTYIVKYSTGEVYDETLGLSKFYVKGNSELESITSYESSESTNFVDTGVNMNLISN